MPTFKSPLVWAAHPPRSYRRRRGPVAGGKPVSIMQKVSDDLLDGGAELHHLIGDAGDRAGSLDDDEQHAGRVELRGARLLSSHRRVG
eukprot:117264-Prymnesium_polylepis.1